MLLYCSEHTNKESAKPTVFQGKLKYYGPYITRKLSCQYWVQLLYRRPLQWGEAAHTQVLYISSEIIEDNVGDQWRP